MKKINKKDLNNVSGGWECVDTDLDFLYDDDDDDNVGKVDLFNLTKQEKDKLNKLGYIVSTSDLTVHVPEIKEPLNRLTVQDSKTGHYLNSEDMKKILG